MQNTESFLNPIIATNARAINNAGYTESQDIANSQLAILNTATMVALPTSINGGLMYGVMPTNGNGDLTWTRASDAWRTNRLGLIQRTPWNFVQYSEQLDNAYWDKTAVTITANQLVSPNGTLTVDKITETTANSEHRFYALNGISLSANSTYTVSFYISKTFVGSRNFRINPFTNSGIGGTNTRGVIFDQTAQFVAYEGTGTNPPYFIQDLGTFYRVSLVVTTVNAGLAYCVIGLCNGTQISYLGNGTSSMYVWGVQWVEGTLPQNYLPTTDRNNVPRIDYSQGTACMLLEPQRTNIILQSQTFSSATWSKLSAGSGTVPIVTSNVGISPDGTLNASRVQFDCVGSTISDRSILQQVISITNSTNYAVSFYVKAYNSTSVGKQLRFVSEQITNPIVVTLTSDWQKVTATATSVSTSTNFIIETRGTITNSATADVLLWASQLEVGAYSTTYIPTTTASVTRLVDNFSRDNLQTNNIVGATSGTWYISLLNNIAYTRDAGSVGIALGDTNLGSLNSFFLRSLSQRLAIGKFVGGTSTTLYTTTTDSVKIAIKWNGTTADVFVNGIKQVSATSFTTTALQYLITNNLDVPKFIQQMALWNVPLSDTQCAALTSDVSDGKSVQMLYTQYMNSIAGVTENINGLINNVQNFK